MAMNIWVTSGFCYYKQLVVTFSCPLCFFIGQLPVLRSLSCNITSLTITPS